MCFHFGVYYIYCQTNWKKIFDEQINSIQKSNLLKILDKLHLVICYTKIEDYEYICKIIEKFNKIEIYISYTDNRFEFEALETVRFLCKHNKCKILYFHTKGASISESNSHCYPSPSFKKLSYSIKCWRNFMENELFYNADKIIKILDYYDACGVNLLENPKHFPGNFWWSKSEHINKLPEFSEKKKRHNAESWLGSLDGNFHSLKNVKFATGYSARITSKIFI